MGSIYKKRYLQLFGILVLLLSLVRCAFFNNSNGKIAVGNVVQDTIIVDDNNATAEDTIQDQVQSTQPSSRYLLRSTRFADANGNLVKHRIYSVSRYKDAFPDSNSVQMQAAKRWGVSPVEDREDAEQRKMDLVYVGSNPYFFVDKLNRSIPYLVPRAAVLLQDIGRNFFDSLQIKGVALHKPIITSVTRSKADVKKLRNYNKNATENSCHLYGTTFDICYNRYKTVSPPDEPQRRAVSNDTLKFILSEVLNDLRKSGRCYIKYEVKQGCFHITVR